MTQEEIENPAILPKGSRRFATYRVTSQTGGSATYEYEFQGKSFTPTGGTGWRTSREGLDRLAYQERLTGTGLLLYYIRYASDFPGRAITNMWTDTGQGRAGKSYVVETNPKVIQRCLLMTTDPGDLVLDPTCGSGTTAYVAEEWGRRWITIDTSRVALALARTRLMEAKYPITSLPILPKGVMKEAELTNDPNRAVNTKTSDDIKRGFVYKRALHIKLKSIANNPEIDDIHAKWQEQLEPLRAEINSLAGENWEEWEIPRPESANHPSTDESANNKETVEKNRQ